jgi:transglutaminase-like putative cysteine protease
MAQQPDPSAGRQRLVTLAAVAGLAAATAFAFGRIFTGRATTLGLVVAAVASVLIAGLVERRGLLVALAASAIGLAFALTWIVLPQTAWYGLPTLRTLRAVGRCLEFVGEQARVQVSPTPALPPLLLAAVTAVWTAAFSSHALAVRAGSPLLAVLPAVALVGFADAVLEDGARPVYAIVFLVATLAVVFEDGLRRVRQWGPVWSSIRGRRLSSITARGARRIAALAVLAAVLVPGLLPGFRSAALVDFSTETGGIGLDPFVSILAQLDEEEAIDLFRVVAPSGSYWRLYALDTFDGTTWSSSDPLAEEGLVLDSPARLADSVVGLEPFAQRIRLLHDLDEWLPMAYPPESVTHPFEEIRYNTDLGAAVVDGGLDEGIEYSVTSRLVRPSGEDLDLVSFDSLGDGGRYTFLPEDMNARVGQIAERWTRDEPTPYRQVLAIQNHFRDGSFSYSQDVEPTADSDALVEFLDGTRRGFCQQFATAMAVMVRELGYPARVAVGFQQGTRRGDTYTVRSRDAHAWVEVFFPGYGWLPFEPTPGRTNPAAEFGTYLNPSAPGPDGESAGGAGATTGGTATGPAACADPAARRLGEPCADPRFGRLQDAPLPPGFLGTPTEPLESPPVEEDDGYSVPYRWILGAVAGVAGALLVLVPVVKWVWRRRMLRRSREPRELVLAAYRVFDGSAADLGLGRADGETVQEHRARLAGAVRPSDGHLLRLSIAAARAAYAPEPPTRGDAEKALRDARGALSDLRRHAGPIRRVLGMYRPGV